MTTFTVIADIAQNVAGAAAIVQSITRPGAEIHDYQPTPGDVVKAQSADLVLWNGMNLERWFERFFDNVREVPSAVVTEGITPLGIAEGPYTGKPNPHAWMSPKNAVVYVLRAPDPAVAHHRRLPQGGRRDPGGGDAGCAGCHGLPADPALRAHAPRCRRRGDASSVLGTLASFHIDGSTGQCIVLIQTAIFAAALLWDRLLRRRAFVGRISEA